MNTLFACVVTTSLAVEVPVNISFTTDVVVTGVPFTVVVDPSLHV